MDDQDIHRIVEHVNHNHNPWGVAIEYRGKTPYQPNLAIHKFIWKYNFFLSGGLDYILSIGTQVHPHRSYNYSKTIFALREAKDVTSGSSFIYHGGHSQEVDMTVTGNYEFHIFEVALELSHTMLKGIYLKDRDR